MTPTRYEFVLPACNENEQIVLPRQSPLGTHEDLQYQPTGAWPANFLCLRHGRVFLHGANSVYLAEVEVLTQDSPQPAFWVIEFQHAPENCRKTHVICTTCPTSYSETDIVNRIQTTNPIVPCRDHAVMLKDQKLILRRVC